jgi:hypothetical protein
MRNKNKCFFNLSFCGSLPYPLEVHRSIHKQDAMLQDGQSSLLHSIKSKTTQNKAARDHQHLQRVRAQHVTTKGQHSKYTIPSPSHSTYEENPHL